MSRDYQIAVVGATGEVGSTILSVLEQRGFPTSHVQALASARSKGKTIQHNRSYTVEELEGFDFADTDIAFFSAGGSISEKYVPRAAAAGCVVIDNSSCFRYEDDIPLVVPEVNREQIAQYHVHHIIANPNCSTIQLVVALKPLYDTVGIKRINIATYQAVSGAGRQAVEELAKQTAARLNGLPAEPKIFPKAIAFNVLPQVDLIQDNGYSREEMKMVWETRKILQDQSIEINPTAVRVPVFYGHSEAVYIETDRPISAEKARLLLAESPGVILKEPANTGHYPTPLEEGSGSDAVYIGRIRNDLSNPCGLNFWVVADNVRKGAALNAVQIAEELIKYLDS